MKAWHMNGAGNDFVIIDARKQEKKLDFPALAKTLCARTGADGFMAIGASETADFRLHFYNSDGSRGEMCGNGSRCICRFAYEQGIANDRMVIQTDAGPVLGWRLTETAYRVQLNSPTVLELQRKPCIAYAELGCPGLPHAVREVPDLTWEERDLLLDACRAMRFDMAFPKGANVNLYTWLGENRIRILTYERGVEDYTLACGTGTGATAAVLWTQGRLPGGKLIAENPGGTLTVTVEGENGTITRLLLEGPTEITEILEI